MLFKDISLGEGWGLRGRGEGNTNTIERNV